MRNMISNTSMIKNYGKIGAEMLLLLGIVGITSAVLPSFLPAVLTAVATRVLKSAENIAGADNQPQYLFKNTL